MAIVFCLLQCQRVSAIRVSMKASAMKTMAPIYVNVRQDSRVQTAKKVSRWIQASKGSDVTTNQTFA